MSSPLKDSARIILPQVALDAQKISGARTARAWGVRGTARTQARTARGINGTARGVNGAARGGVGTGGATPERAEMESAHAEAESAHEK